MDDLYFFEKFNINFANLALEVKKTISRIGQNRYENNFVKTPALKPLLDPIYNLFKENKICLVCNIADGVGHWIAELDYFFRKRFLNEIDAKYFVIVRKPNSLAQTCLDYYGDQFDFSSAYNLNIYNLFLPLMMHYHDITFDAGLSRLRWQIPQNNEPINKNDYVYQINKKENRIDWEDYYRVRKETVNYWPMKRISTSKEEVEDIIGSKFDRLALIHVKNSACNASAKAVDPNTYVPTVEFLRKQGYTVAFVGREHMPSCFDGLVVNYAQSNSVSFANDFKVFSKASNSLIYASGVSLLSEVLEVPLIYVNHWHLARVPFPKYSICVPALVATNSGTLCTFREQIELYNDRPDVGPELFPYESHFPINASSEDILEAAIEMEELIKEYTEMNDLQIRFNKTHNEGQIVDAQSRISRHFVNKYKGLLCAE